MLRRRYHRAIELMDAKLASFYADAESAGLLDDTLLVITSDHGEAFGEHGLYCHDASVYETHLRVPLWIRHPALEARRIADVVSTRGLFDVLRAAALGSSLGGTLLDPAARAERPVALAEHFHYPHAAGLLEHYRHDIAAAVVGTRKLIVRPEAALLYDLVADPEEIHPIASSLDEFIALCHRDGAPTAAIAEASMHLQRWGAPRRGGRVYEMQAG